MTVQKPLPCQYGAVNDALCVEAVLFFVEVRHAPC